MYTDLAGACPEQGRMGGDDEERARMTKREGGVDGQKSPLKMNGLLRLLLLRGLCVRRVDFFLEFEDG